MADEDFPDALPARYRLHWYVLERVLGQGGFGITYLAHDTNLDRRVAIKEYLPTEVARRRSDASARPRTETHAERFAWGLERFLSEARTLARFDHPNIVRVLSVFEANNTAYMVMRFEEGEDLATLLDRRGTLPEAQLVECLLPVLEGLQLIHASGFIHRDIKPENVYIRHDNSPVLLDFGSARQSFGSAKTMTILVAPGYAPLEQYYGDAKTQGPWTDIYGLGATCYRAIAGRAPLDAVARAKGVLGSTRDILQSAAEVGAGRYSDRLLAAVDHALQLSERNRPQNVAEWKQELVGEAAGSAGVEQVVVEAAKRAASADPARSPTAVVGAPHGAMAKPRLALAWAALALVATLLVGAYVGSMTTSVSVSPASAPPPADRSEGRASPGTAVTGAVLPATAAASVDAPLVKTGAASLPPVVDAPIVAATLAAPVPVASTPSPTRQIAPEPRRADARVGGAESQRTLARAAPPTLTTANAAATTLVAPTPTARSDAASSPPLPSAAVAAAAASATPTPTARRSRDDQAIEAAEAALRRGDAATASQLLAPLAAAGVSRAQALLARAREVRTSEQHSDFEAYVWYSIAARNGEPGAGAARDKLAPRLQPAEVRQAAQIVERWKPTPDARGGGEGASP